MIPRQIKSPSRYGIRPGEPWRDRFLTMYNGLPFFEYSASPWFIHYRQAKGSLRENDQDSALRLCDVDSLRQKPWYRLYCLRGSDMEYYIIRDSLSLAAILCLDDLDERLILEGCPLDGLLEPAPCWEEKAEDIKSMFSSSDSTRHSWFISTLPSVIAFLMPEVKSVHCLC